MADPSRRWIAALGLVAGFVLPAAVSGQEPVPVETLPLERTSVVATVRGYGVLERRPRNLYFLASGQVTELRAKEGDPVKKGEVLARLDSDLLAIRKARLELAVRHALAKLERTRALVRSRAVTPDAVEDREFEWETRQLELRDVEKELERRTLRAPGDGRVLQRYLDYPGPVDLSTAMYAVKLDREPWTVTVNLTQREAGRISPGDVATVLFDSIVGKTFPGTVREIAPHTNAADGLVEVEVVLEGLDGALRSGLNARVELVVGKGTSGYRVPVPALDQVADGRATIFVVDAGGVARRQVVDFRLIPGFGPVVESDLSAFEAVVVRGHHALKDGAVVRTTSDTQQ